jgi:hypothetical protein
MERKLGLERGAESQRTASRRNSLARIFQMMALALVFPYMRLTRKYSLAPNLLADDKSSAFAAFTSNLGSPTSLEAASEYGYRYANSYTRMDEILKFRNKLTRPDWLALIGEGWACCDNLINYYGVLRRILQTTGPLRAMMKPQENAAYDALPEKITIYRGCGQANMMGMSWTVDKAVANSFPYTNRYKVPDPLLVTSTVFKRKVLAFKKGRDEDEIITFSARFLSKEPSVAPSPEWWSTRAAEEKAKFDASCAAWRRIRASGE